MVLKVELRRVPTVPMTDTAAMAIKAAIRPYSIAVAAVSSRKSLKEHLDHRELFSLACLQ
jgi:hypothetical protein